MKKLILAFVVLPFIYLSAEEQPQPIPRNVVFVGVDVSGSFLQSKYFDDSLTFLAKYLYFHLNAIGELEVPHSLFVGSLGGAKANEAKTFYPIETFRNASEDQILAELKKIFTKKKENPFTDYNAFFKQVAEYVQNRKLILKPLSIIMISDGAPDLPKMKGEKAYKAIDLSVLELLSRNVTVRLLYTNAVIGENWQNKVPRRRIKVWTQDAVVMAQWKDPKILVPGKPMTEQPAFVDWLKNNVDFAPPKKVVN
ncbi:MAG: hypothetical protein SGJ18_05345 [Pseudomonadota bacterium]|nr:hypothetical protein [Pseudomonadota bacterium]